MGVAVSKLDVAKVNIGGERGKIYKKIVKRGLEILQMEGDFRNFAVEKRTF